MILFLSFIFNCVRQKYPQFFLKVCFFLKVILEVEKSISAAISFQREYYLACI